MNKKERKIILDTYKTIYRIHEIVKIDKSDSIREFKYLLDVLGMEKERYMIENEIIAERDNLTYMQKEMYSLIFETFSKYGKYIHYDLEEIDMYYNDLQFKMTDEENRCHKNQVHSILQYAKTA